MIDPDFLISCGVRSILFSVLVWMTLVALKGKSPQTRASVGHAGLLTLLLLPAVSMLLHPVQVPFLSNLGSFLVWVLQQEVGPGSLHMADATEGSQRFMGLTFFIWGVPAMLLSASLVVSIVGLNRLRRRADLITHPCWLQALARAQARMGFKNGVALLVSDEVNSPVSWGFIRPAILVNRALISDSDCAEAVISHELAHVANFDWAKLLVARCAVAMYWFNPLIWVIARATHHSSEEVADDAVLRAGIPGEEYSALLVNAVRHNVKGLAPVHGVAPRHGSLRTRVARVLSTGVSRVGPPRWTSTAIMGMVAATGLSFGLANVLPSAPLAAIDSNARPVPPHELRPARMEEQSQQEAQVEVPQAKQQIIQEEIPVRTTGSE